MKIGFYKKRTMFALFFLAFFLFIGFSSAYSPGELSNDIRDGIEYFKAFYTPILEIVLGDSAFSDFFFIKVLLLILTFVVVKTVLAKVPTFKDNKPVIFIVAIAVSILSIRYMTDIQIVQGVLMSYDAFGVALTTIIPFLVWFFFVEKTIETSAGRRALWIFFLAVFSLVWFMRYSQIGKFGNYLYITIMVLIILAILLDRQVRIYFSMHEIRRAERSINDQIILELLKKYKEASESATEYGRRRAKEIKDQLKEMGVRV